jgi:hypothetical protein
MLTAVTTTDEQPVRSVRRRRRLGRDELGDRGFTIRETKVSAEDLAKLDAAIAALDADPGADEDLEDLALALEAQRPRTRGECVGAARPCPFVGCRHHLALDVTDAGSLHVNAQLDLDQVGDTCSLDVADRGEHTLEQVGNLLNITRERVRQIERTGLKKSAASARYYGVRDAEPFVPDDNHPEP